MLSLSWKSTRYCQISGVFSGILPKPKCHLFKDPWNFLEVFKKFSEQFTGIYLKSQCVKQGLMQTFSVPYFLVLLWKNAEIYRLSGVNHVFSPNTEKHGTAKFCIRSCFKQKDLSANHPWIPATIPCLKNTSQRSLENLGFYCERNAWHLNCMLL